MDRIYSMLKSRIIKNKIGTDNVLISVQPSGCPQGRHVSRIFFSEGVHSTNLPISFTFTEFNLSVFHQFRGFSVIGPITHLIPANY